MKGLGQLISGTSQKCGNTQDLLPIKKETQNEMDKQVPKIKKDIKFQKGILDRDCDIGNNLEKIRAKKSTNEILEKFRLCHMSNGIQNLGVSPTNCMNVGINPIKSKTLTNLNIVPVTSINEIEESPCNKKIGKIKFAINTPKTMSQVSIEPSSPLSPFSPLSLKGQDFRSNF